jgi:tetratricopeptide (TPR) repeat protein
VQAEQGILPEKDEIMGGISQLMGKDRRSICKGISRCPSVRMAYGLLFENNVEDAMIRFQRILDDDKHDPDALAGLAICMAEDSGRFVSATKLAMLSVRVAPKSPAGYYALAYIHLLGSKLEEGYRYLMKAQKLAPEDPRVALGWNQLEQERPPVIADLPREHFLNKALGKSRHLLRRSLGRVMSASS